MSGDNNRPESDNGSLAGPEPDQAASDTDQTLSDVDQTTADADQTSAERDQQHAESDQAASDRDQAASERDQEAADRDLAEHAPTDARFRRTYDASRAQREEGSEERATTSGLRAHTQVQRAE